MGRPRGKVNEQSLEVLKKNVKAGGRKSVAKAEKKPATPVRSASRSRSRSRSRTPGRAAKTAPETKKTPAKKTPSRKKETPKLKRLDTEKKPARGKKKAPAKAKAKAKAAAGGKASTRQKKGADSSIPKGEGTVANNIPVSTSTSSVHSKGRKSTSPVGAEPVNGSSGWFSKCIIS